MTKKLCNWILNLKFNLSNKLFDIYLSNMTYFRCFATQAAVKNTPEEKQEKNIDSKSQSFVKNIFLGQLETTQTFPFPDVLNEEQLDTLKLIIDPIEKFFEVTRF